MNIVRLKMIETVNLIVKETKGRLNNSEKNCLPKFVDLVVAQTD